MQLMTLVEQFSSRINVIAEELRQKGQTQAWTRSGCM